MLFGRRGEQVCQPFRRIQAARAADRRPSAGSTRRRRAPAEPDRADPRSAPAPPRARRAEPYRPAACAPAGTGPSSRQGRPLRRTPATACRGRARGWSPPRSHSEVMVTVAPAACASRPVIVSAWSCQASVQLWRGGQVGPGPDDAVVPRRIVLCAQARPAAAIRAGRGRQCLRGHGDRQVAVAGRLGRLDPRQLARGVRPVRRRPRRANGRSAWRSRTVSEVAKLAGSPPGAGRQVPPGVNCAAAAGSSPAAGQGGEAAGQFAVEIAGDHQPRLRRAASPLVSRTRCSARRPGRGRP